MNTKLYFICNFLVLFCCRTYSQTVEYKNKSVIGGIGISFNGGEKEDGIGLIYSIGWQKSVSKNERLRINPNLIFGGFTSQLFLDASDKFYRVSSFGLNLNYDLIKIKSFSLVTTGGGFVNYSRGLLGNGGRGAGNIRSEYFYSIYFGGNAALAFRFENSSKSKALEIRPMSFQYGSKEFYLGYMMVAMDFKLKK